MYHATLASRVIKKERGAGRLTGTQVAEGVVHESHLRFVLRGWCLVLGVWCWCLVFIVLGLGVLGMGFGVWGLGFGVES